MTVSFDKRPFVSLDVVEALREYLVQFPLREIQVLFASAGLVRRECTKPKRSGYRRALVEQYYQAMDLSQRSHARKFLRVIESALRLDDATVPRASARRNTRDRYRANLISALQRVGLQWTRDRLVRVANPAEDR